MEKLSVSHIFFDAGGTLVHPRMDRVTEVCAGHGIGLEPGELEAVEPVVRRELDDPEVIAATNDHQRFILYFGSILRYAGVKNDRDLAAILEDVYIAHRTQNLWGRVPSDVRKALKQLHNAGFKLSVISNANGTVEKMLEKLELRHFFGHVLDSGNVGVEKPDPEIFRRAMTLEKTKPHRSLYVGDMYHIDGVGAKNAGMHFALYDPTVSVGLATYQCASLTELPELVTLSD